MPPIRFCLVSTFYPPEGTGGDAVQVERLAHLLAGRGHDVTVVHSADARRPLPGRTSTKPRSDGPVKVVPIKSPAGKLAPLAMHLSGKPMLSAGAIEKALEGPYDVIHFHNTSLLGGPGVFGMGQASLKLYTAHDEWLVRPGHGHWRSGGMACERKRCAACALGLGRPPQMWRHGSFLARSLTALDAVIVPSRASAEAHSRFADLVPIEQIPHFVPPAPVAVRPERNRPYFLYVGRHERHKGLESLIAAFRRRRSEDLLIAGAGSQTSELRAAAADLPHVHFLGWQDREELDALYRGALAVITPSLGHEAFGLAPVEAFTRGTPAIVRGARALAELVEESGAGFTYSTDAELHGALDLMARDEAMRETLGERGRAAHLERWTPEVHLRRYMELIEELAAWRGADLLAKSAAEATGDAREGRLLEMELLRA
jgi:glycosyltransferase involved in cell wall biosynthesis